MKEDDIIKPALSRLFSIFSTKVFSMCFTILKKVGVGLNELKQFYQKCIFRRYVAEKKTICQSLCLYFQLKQQIKVVYVKLPF